jgi:hypothetical protein
MLILRKQTACSPEGLIRFLVILGIFLLGSCSQAVNGQPPDIGTEGVDVTKLTVYLTGGFADDTVTLRADGETLFHKQHMTTPLLSDLTEEFMIEVETGPLSVEVDVETRGLSQSIQLDVSGELHLVIWIEGGAIKSSVEDKPPGFL